MFLKSFFFLKPFSSASLSVFKFSIHYPHKIRCLVMRIKQVSIHDISQMDNKIPPTYLQGDNSGEFSNTSYCMTLLRLKVLKRQDDGIF